jgi:outer membrane receptor protein involved in Fe transport
MRITSNRIAISARTALLGGAAFLGLSLPGIAQAQDATTSAEDTEGNEIIVTATKREQTLQDVPVAVTVTTAETIERAQIRDLKDLSSVVPSLRVNQLQSSANTNFYIRGFGNGANNAGIEPSVGLFIDNVYRSRSASMIADMPDIQRVEVLRGPQSTLFGKNASAGVISIVTREPQFKFGGNVEATYGNFDAMTFKGVVTGPLAESVAVSLAGSYNKRDGYVRDLGTGDRTNERNRWMVRGQLLFEPSSDLKIRLIGDYGKIDENCCAAVNIRQSGATAALVAVGGRVNAPADKFDDVIYNNRNSTNKIENWGLSGQIDWNAGNVNLSSITAYRRTNAVTDQDSDFTSAELLRQNFQDLRIKTFTQEFRATTDFDGPINGLLGGFYFNEKIDQNNLISWGSAARPYANLLVQSASGGALNIGGAPASDLERIFGGLDAAAAGNPALATRYIGQFFLPGTGLNENYSLKDESYSLFGQIDFKVSDRLTLTGGVNYTHDRKRFATATTSNDTFAGVNFDAPQYAPFRNQLLFQGALAQTVGTALGLGRNATAAEIGAFAGANPAAFGQIQTGATAFATANQNNPAANPLNALRAFQYFPPFQNVPNAVEPGKISDGDFSFTARAAYDVTDTVNVYAAYATGYKAASINLSRDSRPTPTDRAALIAQGIAVTNLTSGSRFADPEDATVYEFGIKGNWGLASANVAVFKQTIKGFQSNIFTGSGFFLANAGKQSAFGIEFEGMVKPTKALTLTLAMTYLDPKYDSFVLSAFGDLSGTTPAGVSPLSATFGAQYDHEMDNGDHVILRGDYHYEAPFNLVEGLPGLVTAPGGGIAAALAAAREFRQDINDLNGSLTYAMENGLELSVWGRNLLNDRTLLQVFDSPAQPGSLSGYPSQPRTYGVSARFRW